MPTILNYAATSDRGLIRGNNEDSAFAGQHLLALADGMGGHAAGEVASQLMIATVSQLNQDIPAGSAAEDLTVAMAEGNQEIHSAVDENPMLAGMGCTLTALLFEDNLVTLGHVGDSRAYLLRDGTLTQITKDDTFVQSLVDEGKLDPEAVSDHPQRSLILKAYTGEPVQPTIEQRPIQVGDRYLICSDGLSDPVSNETIQEVLSNEETPGGAAAKLVDYALRSGGPDNVTVVVADVLENTPETKNTVPTTPILVGAMNTEEMETPRPNTAASRAASLAPKSPQSTQDSANAASPKKTTKRIIVSVVILLIIGVIAGLGIFGYKKISNSYYIASDDGVIKIYNGIPGTVLGIHPQTVYQEICLDAKGEVKILEPGTKSKCHLFNVDDLTPSARGKLEDLPTGPYNEVLDLVTRLASETLPVCVIREKDSTTAPEPDADTEPTSSASTKKTTTRKSSDNPTADLTTPGVSCREVTEVTTG